MVVRCSYLECVFLVFKFPTCDDALYWEYFCIRSTVTGFVNVGPGNADLEEC